MPPPNPERWPYRMKDLCEATGLQRQAIHYYIKKGLLPSGHKTTGVQRPCRIWIRSSDASRPTC